jgi:hypothetical protein
MTRTLFGAVRNKPAVKEFSLHVSTADILRRWCQPDWRWTHLPFGEHRNPITGGRLKRMGTMRGWPDFILLSPRLYAIMDPDPRPELLTKDNPDLVPWSQGKTHFLEVKRPKGKLTEEQQLLCDWLRVNGYEYEMADDLKLVIAILQRWGAVPSKVTT